MAAATVFTVVAAIARLAVSALALCVFTVIFRLARIFNQLVG